MEVIVYGEEGGECATSKYGGNGIGRGGMFYATLKKYGIWGGGKYYTTLKQIWR
jgi:hypothetical protein